MINVTALLPAAQIFRANRAAPKLGDSEHFKPQRREAIRSRAALIRDFRFVARRAGTLSRVDLFAIQVAPFAVSLAPLFERQRFSEVCAQTILF